LHGIDDLSMTVAFGDLVRQTVASAPGTGSTIALSGAQTGWLTFALAGVTNGATVRYAINDPGTNNTEIGTATYNSSGPSLTGRTVTQSSNSGAAINASAQSVILSCAAAEDLAVGGTNYGTMAGQNASSVAITGGTVAGLTSLGVVGTMSATGASVAPFVVGAGLSGVWLSGAASPGISFSSVVGAITNYTQELIQFTTAQNDLIAETGLTINCVFQTGYTPSFGVPTNFKDALAISSVVNGPSPGIAGAGNVWNIASDMVVNSTYGSGANNTQNFAVNVEFDISNNAWDSTVGNTIGAIANVFLSGDVGTSPILSNLWIAPAGGTSSNYASHYAILISGDYSVKDASIYDGTNGTFSYEDTGSHNTGIYLNGTYSFSQLQGHDFIIFPSGWVLIGAGTSTQTPLLIHGVDGATSYISAALNAGTSGYGTNIQFTDGATYNYGFGTDSSGNFVWSSGRFPGSAGTSTLRLTQGGLLNVISTGSAGAPSMAIGNSTTGLYSASTTGLGLSIDGASRADYGITTSNVWTLEGTSDTTSYIGLRLQSTTSGYPQFVQFTDSLTYNFAFGANASGFELWSGRFPGNVGALVGDYGNTIPSGWTFLEGCFIPSTTSQTTVGGGWGTGTYGTLPTPGVAGTADNFMAVGFFSSDSTTRTVPYNTSGVLLGNAMNSTLFVGNTSAGTGDPTPQGSSQGQLVSSIKHNASSGSGASVYGQTGAQIINVTGGWAGSATTFTQSVVLSTSSKTITVPAAPTNHAYVPGMPVVGTGIPTSTVIVTVNSTTSVTLSSTPTVNATETLTFWAGTPVTTPKTTTPTVPNGAYNPFAGTPGDTFAVNGQAAIYDNGLGIAQYLQYIVSQYAIGASSPSFQQVLTMGLTTGGSLNTFSGAGVHATGYQAQATVGTNIGFGLFIANAGSASWSYWGASSSGYAISMATLAVTNISDPDIKQDIRMLPSAKPTIMSLDPVGFRFHPEMRKHGGIDRDKEFLGFLARDHMGIGGVERAVDGFAPDVLARDMGSPMGTFNGYCRDEMLPILWRGTQEIFSEVDALKARVAELESRAH
jgi:hypothetical protein